MDKMLQLSQELSQCPKKAQSRYSLLGKTTSKTQKFESKEMIKIQSNYIDKYEQLGLQVCSGKVERQFLVAVF